MAAPAPRFRNAILCDAVYQDESSKKAIIAGVYSGDILADSLPGVFPVAMYLEFFPKDGAAHKIELNVLLAGKKYARALIETAATDSSPIMLLMPPMAVKTDTPARLEIRASIDGGRAVRVIEKQIRLRAPLTDPASTPAS